jgi:anthranilate phosphoribosyltransferase
MENAGAALWVADAAADVIEGVRLAAASIDSGRAAAVLGAVSEAVTA